MFEETKRKVREARTLVRKPVYLHTPKKHFVGLLTAVENWGVRLTWKEGGSYRGEVFNWKEINEISETKVKKEMPPGLKGSE